MADAGEQWAVVYEPLQELKADGPWETRREEFVAKLPDAQDPAIGAFLHHLDELTDDQRTDLLRTEEADTVLYGYLEEFSDSESSESSESGTWADFVATNAEYWDGEEDTWDTFREWFVYEAYQAGFGEPSAALFAELDTQDIDSRIATFGREGGTVAKRKRGTDGGGADKRRKTTATSSNPGKDTDTKPAPRTSGRLKKKAEDALLVPPTLTVTIDREGVATQIWAQAQNIGFHMVVTLTTAAGTPQAIDALYELRQYARDAFDRGQPNVQALTGWALDGPFQPPYGGGISTVNNNNIQFDDHPGFSAASQIAANEWLHTYQVDFYWVVTRLADNMTWSSPAVSNTVVSVYNAGANAPVTYVTGGDHVWNVDNFV